MAEKVSDSDSTSAFDPMVKVYKVHPIDLFGCIS